MGSASERGFGWFLSVVEQTVEGNVESASHFFEGLDTGDGSSIFNAGDMTSKQASASLNFSLRHFLFFAEFPNALSNDH
jgi:hypothetical protein